LRTLIAAPPETESVSVFEALAAPSVALAVMDRLAPLSTRASAGTVAKITKSAPSPGASAMVSVGETEGSPKLARPLPLTSRTMRRKVGAKSPEAAPKETWKLVAMLPVLTKWWGSATGATRRALGCVSANASTGDTLRLTRLDVMRSVKPCV